MADRLELHPDPKTVAAAVHSEGFHGESPETLAGLLELHAWLERKIENLTPSEAEIIRMSFSQCTIDEIASRQGIPKKLAMSRRQRAIGKLAQVIDCQRPRIFEDFASAYHLLSAALSPGHGKDLLLYSRHDENRNLFNEYPYPFSPVRVRI